VTKRDSRLEDGGGEEKVALAHRALRYREMEGKEKITKTGCKKKCPGLAYIGIGLSNIQIGEQIQAGGTKSTAIQKTESGGEDKPKNKFHVGMKE